MKIFSTYPQRSVQNEVYSCMLHNLFDECRFFPKSGRGEGAG